jgi:hypothetical protein
MHASRSDSAIVAMKLRTASPELEKNVFALDWGCGKVIWSGDADDHQA